MDHLSNQTKLVDEVIIVASGDNVENVIKYYRNKLNIKYIHSEETGQIFQRNIGRKEIKKIGLVIFLDDDIILEQDAIDKMIKFWDTLDGKTAGVGFNLLKPTSKYNFMINYLYSKIFRVKPGSVTRAGVAISINNVSKNIETQYLGGGYSVWKTNIIDNYPQEPIKTKWAQGEDLRFSYPISKQYKLFICADAKAFEMEFDNSNILSSMYQGKIQALTKIYFTTLHKELSTGSAIGLLIMKILVNVISIKRFNYGMGQI